MSGASERESAYSIVVRSGITAAASPDAGGRRQEFVLFLFSYVILVVWIFFQVSIAVLLENYLAARCEGSELLQVSQSSLFVVPLIFFFSYPFN